MDNYHSNRQNVIILLMKVSKLVSVCGVENCLIAFDHNDPFKSKQKMDPEISTCIDVMGTFFCLSTNYSNLTDKVREPNKYENIPSVHCV